MESETGVRLVEDGMMGSEELMRPQLLTLRDFRPFKTCDEYLWAMKEDLSDWLNRLYPELKITPNTFMECLETGVTLCKHANNVRKACITWQDAGKKLPKCWGRDWKLPSTDVIYNCNARSSTFFARDNVHNFITWCRKLGIFDCLLFESDDLILRKNEKSVILCLLEVARRGSHFGMAAPLLVQFEKEIDRDIAKDTGQDLSSSGEEEDSSYQEHGPLPQIILNDLRSLDEMVRELVEQCSCPTQFPMIRVAEGKYRIGNTKLMIYVRILRKHVMVRVGGGWTTLGDFLARHDPCRHKTTVSSKFTLRTDGSSPRMKVEYERRDHSFEPVAHSTPNYTSNKKILDSSDSSSEISDEGYKTSDNSKLLSETPKILEKISSKDSAMNLGGRKSNVTRAWSTDDERPDSRSTDEEISHYGGVAENERLGIRNNSSRTETEPGRWGNRDPSVRGGSTERSMNVIQNGPIRSRSTITSESRALRHGTPGAFRSPSSGVISHKRTASVGSVKTTPGGSPVHTSRISHSAGVTRPRAQLRSLSAGGTDEFFKHQRSPGTHRYNSPQNGNRIVETRNPPGSLSRVNPGGKLGMNAGGVVGRINGKNTWSGYNTKGKIRPNVFQNGLYNSPGKERQIVGAQNNFRSVGQKDSEESLQDDPLMSSGYPDLAAWIKQALEITGDQDKIAHIERAIKEFEERRERSPELKATSLPYSCNSDNIGANEIINRNCASPSIPTTPVIRKRKENGLTKIPKPNFY